MAFKIADLVAEATGVNPVTFKTSFADSPLAYPEQADKHPEMPEPTTAEKTVEKAPEKTTEKATEETSVKLAPEKSSSGTPAAQAHVQQAHEYSEPLIESEPKRTVAKSAAAKLDSSRTTSGKRPKAPRAVRKPKATLPKAAKTGEEPDMSIGQHVNQSEATNEGVSKKRTFDEFEITADTDIAALEALGKKPVLENTEPALEAVKRPATKKVKTDSGKGVVSRATKKKSAVEAESSDEEVEHIPAKKPAKKAVSQSTSKATPADAKVKKPAAPKKTPAPKKAAVTKKLEKALKGNNVPGKATKLTPAQIAARKAGSK
ncbi:uncharacterized protein N0V89_001963 [Didymosphaeria variabile]|uniref:Uncharacterized protein n=1 Tax=Didymosphaeria variabile TaxID=1932322 RepID=A0A9W8XSL3_9PLEO|nr:uncharacterized protein N0V89_001963 [Didymosphaeria variabile]KAJ4357388.1 hypothetical protein N0V89_001963 [Didymosphaeria variabile]